MLNTLLELESKEKGSTETTFSRAMFEIKFGDENKRPLEIFDDKMGNIEISGKIDRVDISEVNGEKYGVIIDYKYGKTEFRQEDIEEGVDLQLPIYALALRDVFKIIPVAAEFYALKTLKKTGILNHDIMKNPSIYLKIPKSTLSVDEDKFNKLLTVTKEHIIRYAREICKGRIDLAPHNLDLCGEGRCDFATVCRVDKWMVR